MLKCLFSIFISCFIYSTGYGTDLLDSLKSDTKLVKDLKDVYRAYEINHKIVGQKELINLFLEDESAREMSDLLNSDLKECAKLQSIKFYNDTLGQYVSAYLKSTIQSYDIAKSKGFKSAEFKSDYTRYKKARDQYLDYLEKTYQTSRFVGLTESQYWKTIDKKNYINPEPYARYEQLKKMDLKSGLIYLDSISDNMANFQEHAIYQIEIADQYVKHSKELADLSDTLAIQKYLAILNQRKYCIYLFEAWLKWRTVLQQSNGLSKSSDIPNDEYDSIRQLVATVILKFIVLNPDDEMAINEFILMATHDIVRRFGDYPYGNQNTVEYHEIFDDKK